MTSINLVHVSVRAAILRVFYRSKECKPKKLSQVSGGIILQHRTQRTSPASSVRNLFEPHDRDRCLYTYTIKNTNNNGLALETDIPTL